MPRPASPTPLGHITSSSVTVAPVGDVTCQNDPGFVSSPANGRNRRPPARIEPSLVAQMSLNPVTPSGAANNKRLVPSLATCVMSRPETTTPPSACSARPPTPRRFGTIVSTPLLLQRYTPPL